MRRTLLFIIILGVILTIVITTQAEEIYLMDAKTKEPLKAQIWGYLDGVFTIRVGDKFYQLKRDDIRYISFTGIGGWETRWLIDENVEAQRCFPVDRALRLKIINDGWITVPQSSGAAVALWYVVTRDLLRK